ncbi:outer membrane beta-barrel protein [Vibrio bivalvicida]|uniref:Porin family protein n=1 Tax=Vibrio bivalvicida TaxID=1276888 RepID=A0A177XXH7_9VIBR|nr:outer membrane beta-barrel protein [Vibrio bivalvicida]OAJ93304.1 hypothetical protein APB76_15190 [Vibrio bivalvicida]
MKKLTYLAAILSTITFGTANANGISENYNFVSGGYQQSSYSQSLYYGSSSNDADVTAKGFYARGSFNFYDNFFAEIRKDRTYYSHSGYLINSDWTLDQNLYALGYYYSFSPAWSLYGSIGYSDLEIGAEAPSLAPNTKLSYNMSGVSVEVGARIDVFDFWQVEPAIRRVSYDYAMYELRLNNAFSVTDHLALELNAMHRAFETERTTTTEVAGQIGIRYSF